MLILWKYLWSTYSVLGALQVFCGEMKETKSKRLAWEAGHDHTKKLRNKKELLIEKHYTGVIRQCVANFKVMWLPQTDSVPLPLLVDSGGRTLESPSPRSSHCPGRGWQESLGGACGKGGGSRGSTWELVPGRWQVMGRRAAHEQSLPTVCSTVPSGLT